MKKNETVTSLNALFATQNLGNKLKDEIAKEQKRLWLRTKIHEITGISDLSGPNKKNDFEEIFNWIYQAPIYEWEGMLYCFKYEARILSKGFSYDEALKNAKELYSFLK